MHGDLVFVNMTERFYLCAYKKILWFRHALSAFPSAEWLAIADPDAFIQLAHLAEDLRSVSVLVATGAATRHVLWGLIMWKAYYNVVSEEPANDFSGWLPEDWRAVELRRRLEACHTLLLNRTDAPHRPQWLLPGKGTDVAYDTWAQGAFQGHRSCRGLERSTRRALSRMSTDPPYPFASGPLFAVSRPLGGMLASAPLVAEWRQRLEATQPVRLYYQHGGRIPFTLRGQACYPASCERRHIELETLALRRASRCREARPLLTTSVVRSLTMSGEHS